METIKVVLKSDGSYKDWVNGDIGYIIGFLSNDGIPYCVVVIERTKTPVLVQFGTNMEVII
jgi:hypothetical protein